MAIENSLFSRNLFSYLGQFFFGGVPKTQFKKKSNQILPLRQKLGLTQVNLSFEQREIYSITLSKFIQTFNSSLKLRLT